MAVFKCKMCGGTIEFNQGDTVGVCDSCGTKQTLPRLDDDKKSNLYDRANHFRRNNDFDKAMGIYEQILNEDSTDAEAYWSLVLCRYGIEYVEDPTTHKRVPTVNRAQYTSIFSDEDYKSAINYADSYQRMIYEDEAKAIEDIQKGILEISQKEDPFDVFICYKETDANGRRTPDSVLANDLYHQLTQEGFKVFFSRITLEDKLGTAYEPYIFAALNSAKVMVVLGTKPEYFSAVWVKNEWSRYLSLVKNSGGKKILIPAYKDMDPYDLPEEFSHLQAQDMSKLGFMQDLIRGIKKIIAADAPKETLKETVVVQQGVGNTSVNAQVQRGNMALEDHEWNKADSFFEEALNLDPQCAEAYLGKLLAREKISTFDSWVKAQKSKYADATTEHLEACPEDTEHINQKAKEFVVSGYFEENRVRKTYEYNREYDSALACRKKQKEKQLSELSADRLLSRAIQYAGGDTKKQLDDAIATITAVLDERIAKAQEDDKNIINQKKEAYAAYIAEMDKKVATLNADALNGRERDYRNAAELMKKAESIGNYEDAIVALKAMNGYKDSDALAEQCEKEIKKLKAEDSYQAAAAQMASAGDIAAYTQAMEALKALNGYRDSEELATKCRAEINRLSEEQRIAAENAAKKRKKVIMITASIVAACIAFVILLTSVIIPNGKYNSAVALMNEGKYEEAIAAFGAMDGYKDSVTKIEECNTALLDFDYNSATELMGSGKYEEAIAAYEAINGYKDSTDLIIECNYLSAVSLMDSGDYEEAIAEFKTLDGYKDSADLINECNYLSAVSLMDSGKYEEAIVVFEALDRYKDSEAQISIAEIELLKTAEVGDTVLLGTYEQDNDTSDGKENVEWLVLAIEDDKILVISKYALDCQPYNEEHEDVTWETCTLRSWLNDDFYDAAFSDDVKNVIVQTEVSADKNPKYSTNPGNSTTDNVFLLSITEAEKYFTDNNLRRCAPTAYAIVQGAWTDDSCETASGEVTCWWWLRSPGDDQYRAASVYGSGSVFYNGFGDTANACVRPALWISLES